MKEKGYVITKGRGILQYKQAMQETEHLRDKESLLTKAIGILQQLMTVTSLQNY